MLFNKNKNFCDIGPVCYAISKQKEICKAANLLDISDNDIGDYFFTTKVEKTKQTK